MFLLSAQSRRINVPLLFFFRYLISHDTVSKYPTHLAFPFRLSFFLPVKLFIGMRWSWPGRLAPCATSTALHTFSQPSLWLWPLWCPMPSVAVSTCVPYSPLSPTVWCCVWLSLVNCPAPSRCGTTPCGLFGRLKWVHTLYKWHKCSPVWVSRTVV